MLEARLRGMPQAKRQGDSQTTATQQVNHCDELKHIPQKNGPSSRPPCGQKEILHRARTVATVTPERYDKAGSRPSPCRFETPATFQVPLPCAVTHRPLRLPRQEPPAVAISTNCRCIRRQQLQREPHNRRSRTGKSQIKAQCSNRPRRIKLLPS